MTIPDVCIFSRTRPQTWSDVCSRQSAILDARSKALASLGHRPSWLAPLRRLRWNRKRIEICEECVQMLRVHVEPYLMPSAWTRFDELLETLR